MSLTTALPSSFQLASDEVHSWCASLDVPPETRARHYASLAVDERERSARFRFERDRRRFIAARGVLRELLGCYLQTRPGRIRFVYGAHGKPDLAAEFGNRLKFNLSHSAGLALVAFAADANVGVDLEYVHARSENADVARNFFSAPEVEELNALPNHRYAEGFFRCWTRKEAYLKARGEGLATGASTDIVPATRWSLYTLQPAPGYIGALAIEGRAWRVNHRHYPTISMSPCSTEDRIAVGDVMARYVRAVDSLDE